MESDVDRLLSVEAVADRLGVTERFVRRLIAERRIAFVKLGTHVRIGEHVLCDYIRQSTVEPIRMSPSGNGWAA